MRHASAFSRFAALLPGQALELLNDHDPQPLRNQFARRCLGQFTWTALQAGPAVWRMQLMQIGAMPAPSTGDSCYAGSACCGCRTAGRSMTFVVIEACVRCEYTALGRPGGRDKARTLGRTAAWVARLHRCPLTPKLPLRKAQPFAGAVSAFRPGWPATRRREPTQRTVAQAWSKTSRAQSWQLPQDDATRVSSCSTSKQRVPVDTSRWMSRSETRWQRQTIMMRGMASG